MDWMIWLVAALFYLPLHLGLPALWLFYRMLDEDASRRDAAMKRFLREGGLMLLVTVAVAAWLWWQPWSRYWLVAELLLASLLPFWRAMVLSRRSGPA